MSWYNIFYKSEKLTKNLEKKTKLEITCIECEKPITTPYLMTHPGTKKFYHNDVCALNYFIKNHEFSWRDTIFIHREEALEILEEKPQESKE